MQTHTTKTHTSTHRAGASYLYLHLGFSLIYLERWAHTSSGKKTSLCEKKTNTHCSEQKTRHISAGLLHFHLCGHDRQGTTCFQYDKTFLNIHMLKFLGVACRLTNFPLPSLLYPFATWPGSHASHLRNMYPIAIGESIVSV